MTRKQIEKAAKEAVQDHFQCNGKYPCEERNYCEFCNGHNSAFDCNEDCGADDFNEGFFVGAQWRINSAWHDMGTEVPQIYGDYGDSIYPQIPCLVRGDLSTGYGYGVRYWNVTEQCWDDEECDDYECDKDKIEEWAYLDDLLPERKEETK